MLRGIIIADTKLEFGICDGKIILIDELLTPDSSRFWLLSDYEVGKTQDSYDKQILRDYLISMGYSYDSAGELPVITDEVVKKIAMRYHEIYNILFGDK